MKLLKSMFVVMVVLTAITMNVMSSDFSFAVTCDQRNFAGAGKYDTIDYYRGACEAIRDLGTTSFMVSPGDIDRVSDVAWTMSEVLGADYPWYPVVGNHELPGQGFETYAGENMAFIRNLDKGVVNPGPVNSEETTYSFDRGIVHFIVLNEYANASSDTATDGVINDHIYNWLVNDLNANTQPYVVVFGHEPAFPLPDMDNGRLRHEYDSLNQYEPERDRFWNLLVENNVVAYICGHTHNYSAENINGVWQIDAGHARGLGDTGAMSTFCIIDVVGDSMTLKTYRKDVGAPAYTITHMVELTAELNGLNIKVNSSADDAEEDEAGAVDLISTDLELTYDTYYQKNQTVGLRFNNVAIPEGSVIDKAYIQFTVDEAINQTTSLTIAGHNTDNAPAFSMTQANISGRDKTSATVGWNPAVWNDIGAAGEDQRTPDIKAIIQEIVNRPGWREGNSLAFMISGTGQRCAESYDGEPVAAPVLHIEYSPAAIVDIDVRVNSGNDDAEQADNGDVDLTSSDLEFMYDTYYNKNQTIGVRFNNLMIPDNAIITDAYIQFTVDEVMNDPGLWYVMGHDIDNAPAFSYSSFNVSERPRTTAAITWEPPVWDVVGAAGPAQRTPNLKTIIQEVVDRPGWSVGNSLAFVFDGYGIKCAVAYNGNPSAAPLLHVEYTTSPVSSLSVKVNSGTDDAEQSEAGDMDLISSDLELTYDDYFLRNQTVGLRFTNLSIPQGAVIKNAYVQFTVDEAKNEAGLLTIAGHDTDNAPTFGSSSNNITGRAKTASTVTWSPSLWNTVGAAQQTPEIKSIIQEIVNRPGWDAGNSIALIIGGTGVRCAESYEGDANAAPVLFVEYSVQ